MYLRPDVHFVAIEDDLVLLDVDGDAYFCLTDSAPDLSREAQGEVVIRSDDLGAVLAAAGLAQSLRPRAEPASPLPSLPVETIIHDAGAMLDGACLRTALGVLLDVHQAQRSAGLRPYLAMAPGPDAGARDHQAVLKAAAAFWRFSPLLPIDGACLLRSAMLISHLRRCGLAADWVFGVRLWPFMAHCWVQSESVCLNDDVERLSAFTPILRL